MGRQLYSELIARCLSIYNRVNSLDSLNIQKLDSGFHAFSRVVSSMAALCHEDDIERYSSFDPKLFSGRAFFFELFAKLMTTACNSISQYAGQDALNFSVKELMLAFELAKDRFTNDIISDWRENLSAIIPDSSFYSHAERTTNRNVYLIAGEQLRQRHGFTDAEALINSSWKRQRKHFNLNGMYLDNYDKDPLHNPILYDLTTRVQLKLVRFGGYKGPYINQIDDVLRRGAWISLITQSSAFELPAGGRSNQFLFNEALLAADFEFEANHYACIGDLKTAGMFKQAASLAANTSLRWIEHGKHIKNFFADPFVGAEGYGFYDKYMVTLSSFLSIAYLFSDDSIQESDCPAMLGGNFFCENENFHIITANAGDYSLEIITDPDRHYDSAGLCRLHKRGIPTELGLSHSFTKTPKYMLPPKIDPMDLSVDLPIVSSCASGAYVELVEKLSSSVSFTVNYEKLGIIERYRLTPDGLEIEVTSMQHGIEFTVPLLAVGDGKTSIECNVNSVNVFYHGFIYSVHSNAIVNIDERVFANRNALYRVARFITDSNILTLNLALKGEKENEYQ